MFSAGGYLLIRIHRFQNLVEIFVEIVFAKPERTSDSISANFSTNYCSFLGQQKLKYLALKGRLMYCQES